MHLGWGGPRCLWDKKEGEVRVTKRHFYEQQRSLKGKRLCQDLRDKKRSAESVWSSAFFFNYPVEERVCSDLKKENTPIRKKTDA